MKITRVSPHADKMVELRARIAAGMMDSEIAAELGISVAQVESLRVRLLKEEQDRYTGSTEETFALYATFMSQKIRELSQLYDGLKSDDGKVRQGNAAVGAIKAQADLYEKVVKRGEELGIIKRKKDGRPELIGMNDEELSAEIERKLTAIKNLRMQYGEESMEEIEVPAPPGFKEAPKRDRKSVMSRFRGRKRSKGGKPVIRKASLPRGKT